MTRTWRLLELVAARRDGAVDRDTYWEEMQKLHRRLTEYSKLVELSRLRALEITDRGLWILLENGVRVGFDPDDLRSPPAVILNDGVYEFTELKVAQALGGVAARSVLDVGANVGWYALMLAEHRGERGGVHAFEPVAPTYERLVDNIRVNGFEQRVVAHPFGLSDRNGPATFHVPARTGSVAASERPIVAGELQVPIQGEVRRLDDVAREVGVSGVDFVKCDVEGGEFGFLRGADVMLERDRPAILLEMLRKWTRVYGHHPNDIIGWMGARGYICASVSEASISRITAVTEDTVETNFLFVHRDRISTVGQLLSSEFRHVTFH